MMYDQTESGKSIMAAYKPEVPTSQLVHKKERNLNGFTNVFGVQLPIRTGHDAVRPNWKWEIRDDDL